MVCLVSRLGMIRVKKNSHVLFTLLIPIFIADCASSVICTYLRGNKSQVVVSARDLMEIPDYFPIATTVM